MTVVAREVIEAARQVGADTGVSPAALLAVAIVETGAVAFADIGGRTEPLIRFEGHYFDRRLGSDKRAIARKAGLADPRAGRIANPLSQAGRWRLFERAAAIDREAAAASVSWGLCQVMGAHFERLGYESAGALAEAARRSAAGQIEIAAAFLSLGGLAGKLANAEFARFARAYNGPGYRRNRYDEKIAEALERANALLGNAPSMPRTVAATSSAVAIRRLQGGLVAAGALIAVDGAFGPATRAALRAFQKRAGLEPEDAADESTLARLIPSLAAAGG